MWSLQYFFQITVVLHAISWERIPSFFRTCIKAVFFLFFVPIFLAKKVIFTWVYCAPSLILEVIIGSKRNFWGVRLLHYVITNRQKNEGVIFLWRANKIAGFMLKAQAHRGQSENTCIGLATCWRKVARRKCFKVQNSYINKKIVKIILSKDI